MERRLFFGLTTVDIINFVQAYPGSNEKVKAEDQMVFAGGPAANASVACSALGKKSTLVTALGSHPLAELVKSDLGRHGVELLDCPGKPGQLPVLSSITVDLGNGDRSVVYTNTGGRNLDLNTDLQGVLHDVSLLMFDGFFIDQAVELAREAQKRGVPVVLDGGSWKPGLDRLLPFVTYGICSKDFYPPDCLSQDDTLGYLQQAGIEYVAATGGEHPIIYRKKGGSGTVAVRETQVEDTLGAGDILHGAFCAYCLEYSFPESLELASRVATESCRTRGSRAWISTYSGC